MFRNSNIKNCANLNRVDIMGDDNKLGLLLLNKPGDGVGSSPDGIWSLGRSGVLTSNLKY